MDLMVKARGIEFQCLGLRDCAAEDAAARCPCARKLVGGPVQRDIAMVSTPRPGRPQRRAARRAIGDANPPCPTLGDLLGPALRRAQT